MLTLCAGTPLVGANPKESRRLPECSDMNPISGTSAILARMSQLENSQPSPSIADVAGSPDTAGPDTPAASDFTQTYEMAALANTLRASADMSLALIQMVQPDKTQR